MTKPISLVADDLRCDIVPELGAAISGLWLGDVPVLRSMPGSMLTSVRESGCYPLVPFSNRIAHATLQWNGTSHPLVQNVASGPHAIHGVGWQRPWTVLEADPHVVLMSFEHAADAAWPFAFDTSQAFRLEAGALELSLSVTNQSAQAAPLGLGWHPFFVKRAGSRIGFQATGRWEMGDDKLPTHRTTTSGGLDRDCAALDVDHCFDGWDGMVHLRDELLHTRLSSNLDRLVVFTNDLRDFIAVEPVSHVNNAINMAQATPVSGPGLGVRILQPGESMTAWMRIEVERAP
jgi:aldose 1-epimerase